MGTDRPSPLGGWSCKSCAHGSGMNPVSPPNLPCAYPRRLRAGGGCCTKSSTAMAHNRQVNWHAIRLPCAVLRCTAPSTVVAIHGSWAAMRPASLYISGSQFMGDACPRCSMPRPTVEIIDAPGASTWSIDMSQPSAASVGSAPLPLYWHSSWWTAFSCLLCGSARQGQISDAPSHPLARNRHRSIYTASKLCSARLGATFDQV